MERFTADLTTNLYSNPHSASTASLNTAQRVDEVRLRLLRQFNADPEHFDLVFVANATAGVKLVMEAFRDHKDGFWYGYHKDSHTSLVGVRELAKAHQCFESDEKLEEWLSPSPSSSSINQPRDQRQLLAYPAQSNLNGRRLPLRWCQQLRCRARATDQPIYSLLDAAAFVTTSPLDFSDPDTAPDFTVFSLYKIFGFPDLGALIVRRESGHVLTDRKYFGGGTVDLVLSLREQWHVSKSDDLHSRLEDGTLPIHNIIAVRHALDIHATLFESLERVSRHTAMLARRLHDGLTELKHENGIRVCEMYTDPRSNYRDPTTQGPIVAFNIRNSHRGWMATAEVEKLSAVRNISLRTGGMCNPGGLATYLGLEPWEMKRNFTNGHRCGADADADSADGKPTGMIRVSLGAMSVMKDVTSFLDFMKEFFVEREVARAEGTENAATTSDDTPFTVERLTVYPIKSCAGWNVPADKPWTVRREGLAWDREWCLVHSGSGTALSQKQYPRMALIQPSLDFEHGVMRVRVGGFAEEITVPLSADPTPFTPQHSYTARNAKVCGDAIAVQSYSSPAVAQFFTRAVGVECQLARFPLSSPVAFGRHSKAHLQPHQRPAGRTSARDYNAATRSVEPEEPRPILFSNESPILVISRSSLNRLNEQIKAAGGKAADAQVFRANIVVAEQHPANGRRPEQPYVEDGWRALQIGQQRFEMLGSCRRCQMVCVDQQTAVRDQEPFATLSKTRRFNGRVFFGQHACHVPAATAGATPATQRPTIMVGDMVRGFWKDAGEA